MKIIIDAMGGDKAPLAFLEGGFRAARELGIEVVLVGRVEELLKLMKEQGIETLPTGVELMDAEQVVDMHDDPATVVRTKKESSMVKGLKLLADGGGDAFVSAGSTGGLLSAATLVVKRVRGIRRAAFGPTIHGLTVSNELGRCGWHGSKRRMARVLHVSPSTLSDILGRLKDKGVISIQGDTITSLVNYSAETTAEPAQNTYTPERISDADERYSDMTERISCNNEQIPDTYNINNQKNNAGPYIIRRPAGRDRQTKSLDDYLNDCPF